jgi:tetratricopeptide (TPR) repeat protein
MYQAMFARQTSPQEAARAGLQNLERAVEWDPSNVYAWYFAHAAHRAGDPVATINTANVIESLIPKYRDVVRARASAHMRLGQMDAATEDLSTVVQYDRYDIDSHINRIMAGAFSRSSERLTGYIEQAIDATKEWSGHIAITPVTETESRVAGLRSIYDSVEGIEDQLGFPLTSRENAQRIARTAAALSPRGPSVVRAFVSLSIGYVLLAAKEPHYAINLFDDADREGVLSPAETRFTGQFACALWRESLREVENADRAGLSRRDVKKLRRRAEELEQIAASSDRQCEYP